MNEVQKQYLNEYLGSLSPKQRKKHNHFLVDYFCADEINANICAELILAGKKTATCSLKSSYENESEELPQAGSLTVVTDWAGNPTSIIETIKVTECRFSDVSAEFAASEGEGDKSLEYWKRVHEAYYKREMEPHGDKFDENMIIVCEYFKTMYTVKKKKG